MRYLLSISLLLSTLTSFASHIVGGDIYYDYLGNDNYRFFISVYRDCNSTGAQFDSPLSLGIYSQGNFVQQVSAQYPGSNPVPVVFNNPCVTPPNNICTENALYTVVVNLPPTPGGYDVSYQRCCRGPNITNIINPDDTGFTLTAHVPGSDTGASENSSPRFTNYPPQLLCNNDDLIFDHSATDPDGDQLIYSLITPNSGASSFNPQPVPAPAPPYGTVAWENNFSAANPLGPGASINIDANTGLLTASPNLLGLFVVGIRVQELRNGVVINETVRDFLFRVFNCNLQLESILPTQEDLPDFVSFCQGLTVNFVNNSYGGSNYLWDFGVPGTNSDTSTEFEPSFTYPIDGSYTAMLVVNPGWPCTDTAYMDINVNNEIELSFSSQDSLCIFDNSFDFIANTTAPPGSSFEWEFGQTASSPTGTGQTVNDIQFNQSGHNEVTVMVENNMCTASYTDSVFVFAEPIAEIIVPDQVECGGLIVEFGNASQNSNQYLWTFNDPSQPGSTSSVETPTFTYGGPGTFNVSLVASSSPACTDTTEVEIELNEPLMVAFTSEDSLCINGNSFNFDGTVSGPTGSIFTWNFGPNASTITSNNEDVNNVVFSTTGSIPISLTGTYENCIETVTQEIYLYSEPTIDFSMAPGLQCVPFEAFFTDLSSAETTIYYEWDFGDGGTSTDQNPSHTYTAVGNYNVSLTIRTDAGCIDTLYLLEQDLVNVRPNPTANFLLSTDFTDICHSNIVFTDQSEGANQWYYWFDDSTSTSTLQSPSHTYLSAGTKYPMQIVTNEFGCKDSIQSQLYIEPFTVFAPNTFTPDGNKFNNTFQFYVYLEVDEWELEIYNRWGELVFRSTNVNDAWDGTTPQGFPAQDGTYIWKVRYVSCEPSSNEKTITGHITLLR